MEYIRIWSYRHLIKKIFITVKTYPSISYSYGELVCTAGFTERGDFIRIYPIPFRKLEKELKYKKYQWVEMNIERNKSDFRPESYNLINIDNIKLLNEVKTINNWQERKDIIFKNKNNLYFDLDSLIRNSKITCSKCVSLAIFKPKKILEFIIENEKEIDWDKNKLDAIYSQGNLFERDTFKLVKKLPYRFYYKFTDKNNKKSKLLIEDWEIGSLFWNCLKRSNGDEKLACDLVKNKYLDIANNNDIYLFLGTTKEHHYVSKNPFIIIGVFYPKKEEQHLLKI